MRKVTLNDNAVINMTVMGLTTVPGDVTTLEYYTPAGERGAWAATAIDGVFSVTLLENILNECGEWRIWPQVVYISGERYSGTIMRIMVVEAWERTNKYY